MGESLHSVSVMLRYSTNGHDGSYTNNRNNFQNDSNNNNIDYGNNHGINNHNKK